MGIRAGRGRPKAAGMEYAEIIEAIGREAADLPPGRALDADAVAHLAQTFEPLVAEAQQRFLPS